jgi:ABC-type spermidine/putrescine transport system permease subunit I
VILFTFLYYILSAYIAFIIVWNLIKSKKWQDELLYIIILIPFILRILRLK